MSAPCFTVLTIKAAGNRNSEFLYWLWILSAQKNTAGPLYSRALLCQIAKFSYGYFPVQRYWLSTSQLQTPFGKTWFKNKRFTSYLSHKTLLRHMPAWSQPRQLHRFKEKKWLCWVSPSEKCVFCSYSVHTLWETSCSFCNLTVYMGEPILRRILRRHLPSDFFVMLINAVYPQI